MTLRASVHPKALAGAAAVGCVLAAALAAPASAAAACAPAQLTVTVDNLHSARGEVAVELYADSEKGFLSKETRIQRVRQKLDRAGAEVCLTPPGPGYYALAVYHDENGDHRFNKNALGLPTEGFGLSNNPPLRLGKPTFRSVRFQFEGGTEVTVHMRYLL